MINENSYDYIFLGGDLNTDLNRSRKHSKIVLDFLEAHGMNYCKLDKSMNYTFSNEKRNAYSTIDFWCVTSEMMQYLHSYCTIDSAIIFSDHLPVQLCVKLPCHNTLALGLGRGRDILKQGSHLPGGASTCDLVNESSNSFKQDSYRLRFDHCNHAMFYEYTRVLLEPVLASINADYMVGQDLSGLNNGYVGQKIEKNGTIVL